jgi:ADP-heptose:LPS heptosyltransferase
MSPLLRSLRRAIRPLVSTVLGRIFARGRRNLRPERIERILIIRIDERVGNVLLTTPLIDALEEWFPDAEVDVLVAENKRALLEGIARIVPYEKRGFFRRPWAWARLLAHLRRRRYDVVVDASHWHRFSLTSAVIAAWTGAPLRIAHERGQASLFATETVAPPEAGESEIRTKLRLMAPLGIEARERPMRTSLGLGSAKEKMDAWLAAEGLADPIVGLAPGGRKADHRVDPAVFASLGVRAREAGAALVVLWGPGEERLAEEVAAACGAKIAPPTSLDELAALMRRCSATVTNDTGPMHLSVACGAPTIALFRSADPARWGHAQPPHAVVAAEGKSREEIVADAERALIANLRG